MSKSKNRQSSRPVSPVAKTPKSSGAATEEKPLSSVSKPLTRDAAKYERRQAERQQRLVAQRRARRTRISLIIGIILVIFLAGGLTSYLIYQNTSNAKGSVAPTPTPFQEAVYDSSYPPISNIYCDPGEGQVLHIHAHITIWIDGKPSPIPQGVGIPLNAQTGQSSCFYWLHTHDESGVIHIESPATQPFHLGQFLDEWNQGFNTLGFPSELLLNSGWQVWVNGKVFNGGLDNVTLTSHTLITLSYNSPNVKPDTVYAWPADLSQ
ncbi:MAG TPA: hypothetical protein VFN35_21560 [Ktedonobacteraceae bacterium]|nr:hypothetical protein [Ktedonobacteraceae bacterium]